MLRTTLMILVKKGEPDQVLLGMKKLKWGAGKINGFGGKAEKGESYLDATIREMYEESGIKVKKEDAIKMAETTFHFPSHPDWSNCMHIYVAHEWEGDAMETEEMKPLWFNVDNIPFDSMWADDVHWLPKILGGKKVKAVFNFDPKDKDRIVDFKVEEVDEF